MCVRTSQCVVSSHLFFQLWPAEEEDWCLLPPPEWLQQGQLVLAPQRSARSSGRPAAPCFRPGTGSQSFGKGIGMQLLQGCCRRKKLNLKEIN